MDRMDAPFLLGMEVFRAEKLLSEAEIKYSLIKATTQWDDEENGVFRIIKQEMVEGELLLTISLFGVLREDG